MFRYTWAPPVYEYQKYMDPRGTEVWLGRVELPQVGMPLLNVPQRIGPMGTSVCYSMRQAQVEAAESALKVIQVHILCLIPPAWDNFLIVLQNY